MGLLIGWFFLRIFLLTKERDIYIRIDGCEESVCLYIKTGSAVSIISSLYSTITTAQELFLISACALFNLDQRNLDFCFDLF